MPQFWVGLQALENLRGLKPLRSPIIPLQVASVVEMRRNFIKKGSLEFF